MKNTIINILIFILMFNLIMIIFPEGKTQKYCKITIKIFIFIYIINNLFFSSIINLPNLSMIEEPYDYDRQISMQTVDKDFIDLINKNIFEGEDVIGGINLCFTDDLNVKASVELNKILSFEEIDDLKTELAVVLQINAEQIEINT